MTNTESRTASTFEWQPIETVPNNVFDVLARYWDAGLDKFLVRRFIDCVKVDEEIFAASGDTQVKLTAMGFRPTHWMHIPELPTGAVGDREGDATGQRQPEPFSVASKGA